MLEGKKTIVSGGARGIGRAVVEFFSKCGAKISIVDILEREGEETAKSVGAFFFRADIRSPEEVKTAVEKSVESMGGVDILVNCAGWDRINLFLDTTPDFWRKVVDINFYGVLNMCYFTLPYMVKQKSGAIVNISSDAGRVGSMGEAVYSGAKAGVIAFSKSIAREVARDGIRVNCVCPGPIDTPLLDEIKKSSQLGEKIISSMEKYIPLRRIGKPEDIAPIVAFLASDFAKYITGQTISVNGGLNMI